MPVARTAIILGSVVLVAALAVGAGTALGAFHRVGPQFLVTTDVMPQDVRQQAADWWWIERPQKAKARLVRVHGGVKEIVASAEDIRGYDINGESAVWTTRDGKRWAVNRRRGGSVEVLWSGSDIVGKPALAEGAVVWAQTHSGGPVDSGPQPAIAPWTVVSVYVDGAGIRRTGRLLEVHGDVIGMHQGKAYLLCDRSSGGGQSIFYEASLDSGISRRLAAEEGTCRAVLLESGELAWTAPSRDSSQRGSIACIRAARPAARPGTRADWLPAGGSLTAAGAAPYYAGGTGGGAVWPIGAQNQLPAALTTPAGFSVVSAGQKDMLLLSLSSPGPTLKVYSIPIP